MRLENIDVPEICEDFLTNTANEMAYSTRMCYALELKTFFSWLSANEKIAGKTAAYSDLEKLSPSDISKYLVFCKDNNCAERTIARKRATLSSYFSFLINNKYIKFNPVMGSTRVKIHSSDSVNHIDIHNQIDFLEEISSGENLSVRQKVYHKKYFLRDYAIVLFFLDTGVRVSELHKLNIADIDFNECFALITRKGGNEQHVYFSDETKGILLEYLQYRKTFELEILNKSPLFVTLKGNRLAIRSIQKIVQKYAAASSNPDINRVTVHRLRASFAMAFYKETKDILTLQRKLGHSSIQSTNVYAKATDKTMKDTRAIMERLRKDF